MGTLGPCPLVALFHHLQLLDLGVAVTSGGVREVKVSGGVCWAGTVTLLKRYEQKIRKLTSPPPTSKHRPSLAPESKTPDRARGG